MIQRLIDLEMPSLEYAADDCHLDHWHTDTEIQTQTEILTQRYTCTHTNILWNLHKLLTSNFDASSCTNLCRIQLHSFQRKKLVQERTCACQTCNFLERALGVLELMCEQHVRQKWQKCDYESQYKEKHNHYPLNSDVKAEINWTMSYDSNWH